MRAAIQAQALAAKTTIEFIEQVGFIRTNDNDATFGNQGTDAPPQQVRNVTFTYKKTDDGGNQDQTYELTVPILSIVPIPYLRIDELNIDFTAKLTDTVQSSRSASTTLTSSVQAKYGNWFTPYNVDFRGSIAHESKSSQTSQFIREYKMEVHVRAKQDDMPAGLAKVLSILEASIREKKTSTSSSSGGGGGA